MPGGEADHLRRLESYALRRAGDIKHFQRDLHNISDWRLDPRKNAGVEDMVRDMATQEAAAKEAGEAAKGKAKDGLKEMLGGWYEDQKQYDTRKT